MACVRWLCSITAYRAPRFRCGAHTYAPAHARRGERARPLLRYLAPLFVMVGDGHCATARCARYHRMNRPPPACGDAFAVDILPRERPIYALWRAVACTRIAPPLRRVVDISRALPERTSRTVLACLFLLPHYLPADSLRRGIHALRALCAAAPLLTN